MTTVSSRLGIHLTMAVPIAVAMLLCGCGNQMFRQASIEPLDTPRAVEPTNSVPVAVAKAPFDATAVDSPAFGDQEAASVIPNSSTFLVREPDLPPPNLSDNARNEPAPAAVDTIISPYPLQSSQLIDSGRTLFLNRCVQCHNVGGYGYGVVGSYLVPHPPDLASALVQKRSDGALFWVVTMGQGKMPGLKSWTTPQERWAAVAYVRSLRGAAFNTADLLGEHLSNTTSSPYPVYGEVGFEHGNNLAPFKYLRGAPSATNSRVYIDPTEPQELMDK